jgi:hypothetical protein
VAQVGSVATKALLGILRAETGLNAAIAEVAIRERMDVATVGEAQMLAENIAIELAERGHNVRYPILLVYCDRITNLLREKFRRFSGEAHLTIEVRVSQDRLEGLDLQLQLYVDAITDVLDKNRGDWGPGGCYAGGYDVVFGSVKRGGKNYIQAAKITLEIDISLD